MTKYTVAPEGCRWSEVDAASAEMAYRSVCSWYNPKTRIAIINQATGQAVTFTRQLDGAGNLVKISQE